MGDDLFPRCDDNGGVIGAERPTAGNMATHRVAPPGRPYGSGQP
ncbi:MAG TPA: hypothetical protein VIK40_00390 [Geomonas sp.]